MMEDFVKAFHPVADPGCDLTGAWTVSKGRG